MVIYLQRLRSFERDVRLFLVLPALIGFTVFAGINTVLFNLYLMRLGDGPEFIGLVKAISHLPSPSLPCRPASWVRGGQ